MYSICNGVVEYAGWENINDKKQGFGIYVRIKEDGTDNKIYLAHLSSLNVKAGQRVARNTVVGVMGATGNVTGAHTHVEIRNNGVKKNPATYMGVPNVKGTYNSKDYQIIEFANGTYEALYNMNVRSGIWGNQKLVKDLTADGRKNATSSNLKDSAVYKAGTRFTAQIVKHSDGTVWAKTPSRICVR